MYACMQCNPVQIFEELVKQKTSSDVESDLQAILKSLSASLSSVSLLAALIVLVFASGALLS